MLWNIHPSLLAVDFNQRSVASRWVKMEVLLFPLTDITQPSTTEKLVISWTFNLNQKQTQGLSRTEMEKITAELCGRTSMPNKQLAQRGCKRCIKALKLKSVPTESTFQQLKACPMWRSRAWYKSNSPLQGSLQTCTCSEPREVQGPEDISRWAIGNLPATGTCCWSFPSRLPSWKPPLASTSSWSASLSPPLMFQY